MNMEQGTTRMAGWGVIRPMMEDSSQDAKQEPSDKTNEMTHAQRMKMWVAHHPATLWIPFTIIRPPPRELHEK